MRTSRLACGCAFTASVGGALRVVERCAAHAFLGEATRGADA